MESDHSILEITNDDDSLIHESPHPSRASPTRVPMDYKNPEMPSCSQHQDRNNKGNFLNQVDSSKPTPDSQNIKRRRRGGGYNLRKSLAWDRAFFTEEGVLNPLELSMITGTNTKSSRGGFPVHHREKAFLSGDTQCPVHIQDFEETKEQPHSSRHLDTRKTSGSQMQRHQTDKFPYTSPTSKGIPVPGHSISRSGTKRSGCPRPMPPSSPKRPANLNTTNEAIKGPTPPKACLSKLHPYSLAVTSKRDKIGANCKKYNQTVQPAIQKSAAPRGSAYNSKIVKREDEADIVCKPLSAASLVRDATGIMKKSSSEMASSTKSKPVLVTAPNRKVKVLSESLSGSGKHYSNKSTQSEPSRAHSAQSTDGNKKCVESRTAKPSGLRMPSPSLGYFTQPKVSASHRPSQRSTEPCKLSAVTISNSQPSSDGIDINDLKRRYGPRALPNAFFGVAETGAHRVSRLVKGSNVPCATIPFSHRNMRPDVEFANLNRAKVQDCCVVKDNKLTNALQELPCVVDDAKKQFQSDAESLMHNSGLRSSKLQMNDEKSISDATLHATSRSTAPDLGVAGSVYYMGHALQVDAYPEKAVDQLRAEYKHQSANESCILTSQDVIVKSSMATSLSHKILAYEHHVSEQSGAEAQVNESLTGKNDCNSCEENHKLQPRGDFLFGKINTYEEFQNSRVHDNLSPNQGSIEISTGRSDCPFTVNISQKCSTDGGVQFLDDTMYASEPEVRGSCHDFSEQATYDGRISMPNNLLADKAQLHNENMEVESCDNNFISEICKEDLVSTTDEKKQSGSNTGKNDPCPEHSSRFPASKDTHKEDKGQILLCSNLKQRDTQGTASSCTTLVAGVKNTRADMDHVTEHLNAEEIQLDPVEIESAGPVSEPSVQFAKTTLNENLQHLDVRDSLSCRKLQEETSRVTEVSESRKVGDTLHHELAGSMCCAEEKDAVVPLRPEQEILKQDAGVKKPPQNVAPFSEEWLAMMEAAGEEILSMKSGTVQNSPTEKPLVAPGPWSPVKKKSNQEIGPYDCTKYTSIPPSL